jgi:hypothetical protein
MAAPSTPPLTAVYVLDPANSRTYCPLAPTVIPTESAMLIQRHPDAAGGVERHLSTTI